MARQGESLVKILPGKCQHLRVRWLMMPTVCLGLSLGLSVAVSPAVAEDALVESGRKIFAQYCSSCHGLDGKGGGPVSRLLKIPPRDLTVIAARRGGKFPVDEITAQIDGRSVVEAHGPRDMPVWGRQFSGDVGGGSLGEEVSEGKIQALIHYLQSIQSNGAL